jgi:uncharacterized membrane protein YgcG
MNYKNYITGEVISEYCYNKLRYDQKKYYSKVIEPVTHQVIVDDSGDFVTALIAGEIIETILSDDDSFNSSSDLSFDNSSSDSSPSTDFGGGDFGGGDFGGGDFGGGGAGGDW